MVHSYSWQQDRLDPSEVHSYSYLEEYTPLDLAMDSKSRHMVMRSSVNVLLV